MAAAEQQVSQETAPEQANMSADSQEGYGTMTPRSQAKAHAAAFHEGMKDFCNQWVVDESQFSEMEDPHAALMCARALRVFLIIFITMSTIGLCVGFVMKGALENPMATEGQRSMDAPSVVVCPSPWGSEFSSFHVNGVSQGLLPGNHFHAIEYEATTFDNGQIFAKKEGDGYYGKEEIKKARAKQKAATAKTQNEIRKKFEEHNKGGAILENEHVKSKMDEVEKERAKYKAREARKEQYKLELQDTYSALSGCRELQISTVLRPRGKVAEYTSFDTVRVSFMASSNDGHYNFGFVNGDGPYPQRWYSGTLAQRVTGEINYDQLNVGASDVSEGTPHSVLNYASMGTIPSPTGSTEVEFFYGYFFIRVLAAQKGGLTMFAVIAFILLLAASINNCGLFELFFQEWVPEDEPPATLEPNIVCQAVCGKCFSSCRRAKAKEEGDPQEEAEEGAAATEGAPAGP